jgi:hypothetical protein
MTTVRHGAAVFGTYESCRGVIPAALAPAATPVVEMGARPAPALRNE